MAIPAEAGAGGQDNPTMPEEPLKIWPILQKQAAGETLTPEERKFHQTYYRRYSRNKKGLYIRDPDASLGTPSSPGTATVPRWRRWPRRATWRPRTPYSTSNSSR